jgi:tetratricopeptide (TPR) repeat protein
MLLNWLNGREAAAVGTALADEVLLQTASDARANGSPDGGRQRQALQSFLQRFLQKVDREARPLQLNLYKRAKLANTFKWRLLDKGIERPIVDELTQALVLRLTPVRAASRSAQLPAPSSAKAPPSGNIHTLLARASDHMARGAWAEAVECYEELLRVDPRHAVARSNLGAAFCNLGRYAEAEAQFRQTIQVNPKYADGYSNLGTVLRWRGAVDESEAPLRRAIKLKPAHVDAQINLSITLVLKGRWREAKSLLERVLRVAPNNVAALVSMGQIAAPEGRFAEAEEMFRRAAEVDPQAPAPWAAMVWLRKMKPEDAAWAERAEQIAAGGPAPVEEATLRYAMGKYYDDVGDFKRAFRSYQRANELRKMVVEPYDRDSRTRFVDDMIRTYTRETVAPRREGASDSTRPVFVVGMPRSGTSLVEQILASHPAVKGAGELPFWSDAMRRHEPELRAVPVGAPLAGKLASAYLRILETHSPGALRVIDKATFNSEYLGVIHGVLPQARMIYVRRDPIDSCLSCYFTQLSGQMNFTLDLTDLAHYYHEHQRLVAHWRNVLPPGVLLDVPYEELVADQEGWTRKMIDFLGLEWDERCLDFHRTERTVTTASFWQVRQKIFKSSVARWHHYKEFIGPLRSLRG